MSSRLVMFFEVFNDVQPTTKEDVLRTIRGGYKISERGSLSNCYLLKRGANARVRHFLGSLKRVRRHPQVKHPVYPTCTHLRGCPAASRPWRRPCCGGRARCGSRPARPLAAAGCGHVPYAAPRTAGPPRQDGPGASPAPSWTPSGNPGNSRSGKTLQKLH